MGFNTTFDWFILDEPWKSIMGGKIPTWKGHLTFMALNYGFYFGGWLSAIPTYYIDPLRVPFTILIVCNLVHTGSAYYSAILRQAKHQRV